MTWYICDKFLGVEHQCADSVSFLLGRLFGPAPGPHFGCACSFSLLQNIWKTDTTFTRLCPPGQWNMWNVFHEAAGVCGTDESKLLLTSMQSKAAQRCLRLARGRESPTVGPLPDGSGNGTKVGHSSHGSYRCASAGGVEERSFQPCRKDKTHLWWVETPLQLFSFYFLFNLAK